MSFTFSRVPIGPVADQLQVLAEREYDEVGQKDLDRLNVDWARYRELDAAGKLATFIAKRDGNVVGYAVFVVQTHIHYQDALVAANSAVYVVPDARAGRVVLKLLRYAEIGLKAQGVKKVYYHVKREKDFGRLLEHLGYQDCERMFAKALGPEQD
jgi:N-acetylglutamate synthase-like GNAT family acetyltransferase